MKTSPMGNPACRFTQSSIRGAVHHRSLGRRSEASSSTRKTLASNRENICGRTPQVEAEASAPQSVTIGGDVRPARRAQENQKERSRYDGGKGHDESAESRQPVDAEQQDFREPFVVYPGMGIASKRIRIGVEDAVVLQDQLSGAEMPPDVRVGHAAHGHGKQAERQDGDEYPASLQEADHSGKPIVAPGGWFNLCSWISARAGCPRDSRRDAGAT